MLGPSLHLGGFRRLKRSLLHHGNDASMMLGAGNCFQLGCIHATVHLAAGREGPAHHTDALASLLIEKKTDDGGRIAAPARPNGSEAAEIDFVTFHGKRQNLEFRS